MSLTTCNVHFSQQSNKVVYLSGPLLKQLKLSDKTSVRLKLGNEVINAEIKQLKRPGNHLYLSAGIRQTIRVPKSGNVYVLNAGGNELQLGPLVGILSDNNDRSESNPFGPRTGFIKEVIRTGEHKAYLFGFTPSDINWQQETVNGYFLNAQEAGSAKSYRSPMLCIIGSQAAKQKHPLQ